ncbi:hypothetical protein [Gordonia sp. N1V]|uniref:hypothetical protein n=1 Tax=Gordonia sp. N1V TaxID=3034163 RepID=UPI0023E2B8BE|nr:hypothetical protein [Gordonia sp. N1V]MDF3283371.1 hypothetical protein [Gordonia sp. N1V]
MSRPTPGLRTADAVRVHLRDDPAAEEVAAIQAWAEELQQICDAWLDSRERLRAAQAERAEAREHMAATELLRGAR